MYEWKVMVDLKSDEIILAIQDKNNGVDIPMPRTEALRLALARKKAAEGK